MKKIYILFLVITSYACTAQILLNGRLIHELPAKSSVDTGDLIIVANPATGKPYKARKSQVVAGANGVTDGDKGDITVTGSGAIFTIDGSSVQNGKLAMMGDNTFKGNLSGTTASPQDLTAGQVISALGINLKMAYTDTASLSNRINAKQNTLVSGSNIKSVNGNSLIGSGDLTITSAVAWGNITGSNIMLQTDLRDSFEHRIAAGTTGQYWRGDKTWQTLNKAAVGLSAVDNTADVDKPISNATNAALAGKQAQLVSGTNIKTINFIDLLGSGNITIAGGSGGGETLDQTLALGNTTDTGIVFHLNYQNSDITQSYLFNPLVPNGTTVNKVIKRIRMSEYNAHADSLVGDWKEEIGEYEVNADGRKNVVWSWGYNIDQAKNDGYMRMGMESHYIINNKPNFEWHAPEVMTKDGEINRWYSIIGRKDTAQATHIMRGSTLQFLDINTDVQNFGFDGSNWNMKGDYITWSSKSNTSSILYNLQGVDAIHNYAPATGGNVYINTGGKWIYNTSPRINHSGQVWTDKYFASNSVSSEKVFKIDGSAGEMFNITATAANTGVSMAMYNSAMFIHAADGSTSPLFRALSNSYANYFIVQNDGQVAIGTGSPAASSIFDITSTTKGFLPPRMTKTQRDAISSPATGLVIYQTDNTPGLRCYNGTNWMRYTETAD